MGKELTWYFVINNPGLASQQEGQRNVIRTLLRIFRDAADDRNFNVFPIRVREAAKLARSSLPLST